MKKILVLLLALTLILGTGIVVSAEAEDVPEWFAEMLQWRRDKVDEALVADEITEEEAQDWLERIEYMEEFHNETGFEGMGFGEGCQNGAEGFAGKGFGGRGAGRGCRGN